MNPYLRKLFRFNWVLLALMVTLCACSIVAIYSATFMRDSSSYLAQSARKQTVWIAASMAIFVAASLVDYRWVKWGALPVYIAGVGLLVLCKFIGHTHYGAKSWLEFGGVSLQPSQLAILGGIMIIALLLSEYRRMHPMFKLLLCGLIAGPPCLLVAAQPAVGRRHRVGAGGAGHALRRRHPAALPAGDHPGGRGRHAHRRAPAQALSVPAFDDLSRPRPGPARGRLEHPAIPDRHRLRRLARQGFKAHGTLVEQDLLPKNIAHTDFIFSVIGEAYGFIGGVALLAVLAMLLVTVLYIAYQAKDQLGLMVCIGVSGLLFTHIFMNAGMTISLVPIAGLPLPIISYGGTFVMIIMFALGMVQSVWIHRRTVR